MRNCVELYHGCVPAYEKGDSICIELLVHIYLLHPSAADIEKDCIYRDFSLTDEL